MILILGGTADGRRLGKLVAEAGLDGTISMVGATEKPAAQALPVRIGGFGGKAGLSAYIKDTKIRAIVDATHPFARLMTDRAATVAADMGVPFLRFERPAWRAVPGDQWRSVAAADKVQQVVPKGSCVFLATGPMRADEFGLAGYNVLCRRIDATQVPPPDGWRWAVGRPPFSVVQERDFLTKYGIDIIVSKNSGGEEAYAKLEAARELGLPVVLVDRPPLRDDIPRVGSLWAVLDWIKAL